MTIDIVVVNWNSGTQLQTCVESILTFGHGLVSRIIIVDNASTDDSLAHVKQLPEFSIELHIVSNTQNRGFSAACNQGAAFARSECLLFLNPDTRLFPDSLLTPLTFMRRPENIDLGIIGIQLLGEHDQVSRSCARFPSPAMFFAQSMGINRLPGLRNLSIHMTEWAHDETVTVDHVIGAFYFMRRSLFEALDGFDERFFVYLEDLDFSLRARQAGWRSVYLADAKAFHAGGGTSRQVKANRLFYSLRSRLLYGFKHFTSLQAWMLLGVTLLFEPVSRTVLSLFRGGIQDAHITLRAYGMLYRDLVKIYRNSQCKQVI